MAVRSYKNIPEPIEGKSMAAVDDGHPAPSEPDLSLKVPDIEMSEAND